jgi:uncharacterized protein YndB with AHSA1/START domain
VVVERELAHPPEKVWRALTQPHLLEAWLMQSDFQPLEGHRFSFSNDPRPGVHVSIDCEVTRVEPNKTLAYTWQAYGTRTMVTFTLSATATGTALRLEQSGFTPDQELAYRGSRAAWTQFLGALDDLLGNTN